MIHKKIWLQWTLDISIWLRIILLEGYIYREFIGWHRILSNIYLLDNADWIIQLVMQFPSNTIRSVIVSIFTTTHHNGFEATHVISVDTRCCQRSPRIHLMPILFFEFYFFYVFIYLFLLKNKIKVHRRFSLEKIF